jgi:hypothetical protein
MFYLMECLEIVADLPISKLGVGARRGVHRYSDVGLDRV